MTRGALYRSWLVTPPLGGFWLIIWVLFALPVAGLLDWTMYCPDLAGECCTPLYLFVLLSVLLFGWRAAVVSALAALAVSIWMNSIHIPAMSMPMPNPGVVGDLGRSVMFLAISAVIIGSVEFVRRTLSRFARLPDPHEHSSGIIFSLERGQAWASWPGEAAPVRLGPQQEVEAMMHDFLAHGHLARRLGGTAKVSRGPGRSPDSR